MRKGIESKRVDMEMKDASWECYKVEGKTLKEILGDPNKPDLKDHPGKCLVWTKNKGWEAINVKN